MVNESNFKYDHFPHLQPATRDVSIPRFGRPVDIRGAPKLIKSIAWSCDGKRVAVGTEYKGLKVYEVRTVFEGTGFSLPSGSKQSPHNGHVAALAWSPIEGNVLLSGCKAASGGSSVVLWDVTSPSTPIATFKIPGDVLHLAFHPSGDHFAVVCPRSSFDEVLFYHRMMDDGKEIWKKRDDIALGAASSGGYEEINSLRFSNSGKLLLAVSNDGSIASWVYPLRLTSTPSLIQSSITQTPDNLSLPEDSQESNRPKTPRESTPEEVPSPVDPEMKRDLPDVDMPDQSQVDDSTVEQVEDISMMSRTAAPSRQATPPSVPAPMNNEEKRKSALLKRVRHSVVHCSSLLSLSLDPTGKFLAVGGQDALLSLFDTKDWICVRTFDVCTMAIRHSAFSPDGEMIAVGGDDSYIVVVAIYTGATIAKFPITGFINSLAWHPKRNMLAWSTTAKTVPVWYLVQQEA